MNKGRKVIGKFTEDMVRKVADLNENVAGTTEWYKYRCMNEVKRNKGNWKFSGWYIPNGKGDLVSIGDNLYVYREPFEWCGDILTDRYLLTDNVRKALGLEAQA